jgi:hypothetical protein
MYRQEDGKRYMGTIYIDKCRYAYKMLVRMTEGKIPLGRARRRWEGDIKMNLREVGFGMLIGFIWLMLGAGGGLL